MDLYPAMNCICIMHCSLPVISLLTCCQEEEVEACTCLYSLAFWDTKHQTPRPGAWALCPVSDIGTTAVRG